MASVVVETSPDIVMPDALRRACEENPHLFEYVRRLHASGIAVPEYLPELSRKMADRKEPNLIYPVGSSGIFVHILFDETGDRHTYIPIEPTTTLDLGALPDQVEDACIAVSENIPGINPDVDRQKHLL